MQEEVLAEDSEADERIESAARMLDGQKLTAFALDSAARTSSFAFDLGGTLLTWAGGVGEDEQWSLYMPGSLVLTYRSDGCFSFGRSNVEPESEVWHALTGSVRVS